MLMAAVLVGTAVQIVQDNTKHEEDYDDVTTSGETIDIEVYPWISKYIQYISMGETNNNYIWRHSVIQFFIRWLTSTLWEILSLSLSLSLVCQLPYAICSTPAPNSLFLSFTFVRYTFSTLSYPSACRITILLDKDIQTKPANKIPPVISAYIVYRQRILKLKPREDQIYHNFKIFGKLGIDNTRSTIEWWSRQSPQKWKSAEETSLSVIMSKRGLNVVYYYSTQLLLSDLNRGLYENPQTRHETRLVRFHWPMWQNKLI